MRLFLVLLLLIATTLPAPACFGPKLYLAADPGADTAVLFEVAALYVKEKTGVEMVRTDLAGEAPKDALRNEKADLAWVRGAAADAETLLYVDGLPRLVCGPRVLEDLQFTTVAPALRKLGRLLSASDLRWLLTTVESGTSPAAAARQLLTKNGWI